MFSCWEIDETLCSVLERKGFWDNRKTVLWFWDGHFPLRYQRKVSKKKLRESSYAFASYLIKKFWVGRDEPIGIILPNIPEFVFAYFGIWLAGCVAVPMNPRFTKYEFSSMIKSAGIKRVVVLDKMYPEIADIDTLENIIIVRMSEVFPTIKGLVYIRKAIKENIFVGIPENDQKTLDFYEIVKDGSKNQSLYFPKIMPESNALLLFTSGTTGVPKIVVHTHKSLLKNTFSCKNLLSEILGKENFENEMFLAAAPYFHIMGLSTMLHLPLLAGSKIIMTFPFPGEDFGNKLLSAISFAKVSIFVGAPRFYELMVKSFQKKWKWKWFDFSCFKICISGSVEISDYLRVNFKKFFKKNILEGYGMSESGITHCQKKGFNLENSVGSVMSGVEHKILNPDENGRGEVLVKSTGLMKEYLNAGPEEEIFIDNDGWLHTADLGFISEKSELFLVGRKRYLIKNSHGENIYPLDIERVLCTNDFVLEAAVISKEIYGYVEIVAYVVLKKNVESEGEIFIERILKKHCAKFISSLKIPKKIYFVSELPKNIFGKVLRNELK